MAISRGMLGAGLLVLSAALAGHQALAQRLGRLPPECREQLVELCRDSADRRACIRKAMPELPDSCRKAMSDTAAERAPALPAGFSEHAFGSHKLQKLDLGLPADPGGKAPALLFVHGGGWAIGDKRMGAAAKGQHFVGTGWAFASTNYRLVPEGTVEQQAEDVAAAIAFLRRQKGVDPDRIVLMGHSAGAHLVALVGTDPRYLKGAGVPLEAIRGVVLLDGAGYDVAQQMATRGNLAQGMFEQAFGKDPQRQASLSPTRHAQAPNASRWLILPVASREDSTAESHKLAAALRAAGSQAVVSPQAGKTHATLNRELGEPEDPPTAEVDRFLAGLR